ncbi:hypothetical protein PINS_up017192 [Pythium insidiosum]|nr:hypothetical protein PINS_up017192 [Pythium insidiosum]
MAEDGYNPLIDFRLAQERNLTVLQMANATTSNAPQAWHFPALGAEYCFSDDSMCGAWMANQKFRNKGSIDSRYCVGTLGCIAISICEASRLDLEHPFSPHDVGTAEEKDGGLVLTLVSAISFPLAIVAFSLLYYRCCRRNADRSLSNQQARHAQLHAMATERRQDIDCTVAPRAPLDLAGWRAQHAERVHREKLRLAGAEDSAATYLEFDAVSPGTAYLRMMSDAHSDREADETALAFETETEPETETESLSAVVEAEAA